MTWKKEQINSFVREVLINRDSPHFSDFSPAIKENRPLLLGAFIVPWTRGERNDAISYLLAQDAFELSEMLDVISPMVYHKMCGTPATWVREMTAYYKETAKCDVWPIAQSVECGPETFREAVENAAKGMADGLLVYSFFGMKSDKDDERWNALESFMPPVNFISNPEFKSSSNHAYPDSWTPERGVPIEAKGEDPLSSQFFVTSATNLETKEKLLKESGNFNCLGIKAGANRQDQWVCQLPPCVPGQDYSFTAQFYRDHWAPDVYPSVGIWGQEFNLNTHHMIYKDFQTIRAHVRCPEQRKDNTFRFKNNHPGMTFWMGRPLLIKEDRPLSIPEIPALEFYSGRFFPIGIYGGKADQLETIKSIGINTVFIGSDQGKLKTTIEKCRQLGLKYVLSVPRNPERLKIYLDSLSAIEGISAKESAFYVNDEPEIRSFPINQARDIQAMIKGRFPDVSTCMAVVRPQGCRDYLEAADFFMMDQYPVPDMPMSWLSDSMDRAAQDVGRGRLLSVIQAFGGGKHAAYRWKRPPTCQEMDCLAFLSIIHGSQGVFFYTYSEMGQTAEGREALGKVINHLHQIYPWLLGKNLNLDLTIEMVSAYGMDQKGRPAVQACLKKKDHEFLLVAVNTIGTEVEAKYSGRISAVDIFPRGQNDRLPAHVTEVFSEELYPVMDGAVQFKLEPYQTKAFRWTNHEKVEF
jgi:hypothetical protein